jgi:hypothetical protein
MTLPPLMAQEVAQVGAGRGGSAAGRRMPPRAVPARRPRGAREGEGAMETGNQLTIR